MSACWSAQPQPALISTEQTGEGPEISNTSIIYSSKWYRPLPLCAELPYIKVWTYHLCSHLHFPLPSSSPLLRSNCVLAPFAQLLWLWTQEQIRKQKNISRSSPREKKNNRKRSSTFPSHITLLFLWWSSLFQIGFLLSSKFYFKSQGPMKAFPQPSSLPFFPDFQCGMQIACQVVLWLKLKTKEKTCHAANVVFLLLYLLVW